ncbi:MAG: hypothetical protein ACI835_000976 [Planctomycetota bacterium]|jgi:hypothetical protein
MVCAATFHVLPQWTTPLDFITPALFGWSGMRQQQPWFRRVHFVSGHCIARHRPSAAAELECHEPRHACRVVIVPAARGFAPLNDKRTAPVSGAARMHDSRPAPSLRRRLYLPALVARSLGRAPSESLNPVFHRDRGLRTACPASCSPLNNFDPCLGISESPGCVARTHE